MSEHLIKLRVELLVHTHQVVYVYRQKVAVSDCLDGEVTNQVEVLVLIRVVLH